MIEVFVIEKGSGKDSFAILTLRSKPIVRGGIYAGIRYLKRTAGGKHFIRGWVSEEGKPVYEIRDRGKMIVDMRKEEDS